MAMNLTIVKIHHCQDKTLVCRNCSTFEDWGLGKYFPLPRRVVEIVPWYQVCGQFIMSISVAETSSSPPHQVTVPKLPIPPGSMSG